MQINFKICGQPDELIKIQLLKNALLNKTTINSFIKTEN